MKVKESLVEDRLYLATSPHGGEVIRTVGLLNITDNWEQIENGQLAFDKKVEGPLIYLGTVTLFRRPNSNPTTFYKFLFGKDLLYMTNLNLMDLEELVE